MRDEKSSEKQKDQLISQLNSEIGALRARLSLYEKWIYRVKDSLDEMQEIIFDLKDKSLKL